jgi:hypothetical protein
MKDELKESFAEYLCEHDQGILQRGDDTDIDVAERAFQRAWEIQQDKVESLKQLESDLKQVASLILTTCYTVNDKGERVMDGNEFIWIDAAVHILKKYHKRK